MKTRKAGRPASKNPASIQVNVRLTQAQRVALQRAADRDRRSLSDWCRLTLLDAAAKAAR